MATLVQILSRRWAGNAWTLDEDDYSTLLWGGPDPKPSESEARALSDEVDTEIAAERLADRQQVALTAQEADYLLRGFEIIINGLIATKAHVDSLESTLKANAIVGPPAPWDQSAINAIQAMQQKIQQARSVT